jgi:hypothetical protein
MQEVVQLEPEVVEPAEMWVIVPGMYEKWVHPSNKNDKHYRVIYRSNKGGRKVGDEKFRTATEALEFADTYNRRELDAVRQQGDHRS